jgi:hypothetical protein
MLGEMEIGMDVGNMIETSSLLTVHTKTGEMAVIFPTQTKKGGFIND